LDKAAIILANEQTSRVFPDDKGAMLLCNKPLIKHVFDAIDSIVDEVIIVTNTQERAETYAEILPKTVKFVIDKQPTQNMLSGTITGFEAVQSKYTLLLPYDSPLVNKEVAILLLDLAVGKTAAVPRNADNEIEPLCSVYHTKLALETAKQVAAEGATDLQTLVETLQGVRYISKMIVEQIDPELQSFFSVNTPLDIKRATIMLQGKKKPQKSKH
jgi:molybdopterin-guanine dinucleotide biosynthesis protein A